MHVAGLDGMPEGILVHPCHHEHASAFLGTLLHNGWNQSPVVVFEIQLHQVISEAGTILRKKNLGCGFAIAVWVSISEDRSVATATNAAPRYRYYDEAPGTVTLPAGELMARLPGEFSRGGSPGDRSIEIPCADLLVGNTPRIALSRLQELVPDLVQIPEGRDPAEKITLPPGWIALYFKMVTRREELPPEVVAPTAPDEDGPEFPKKPDETSSLVKTEEQTVTSLPVPGSADAESSPPTGIPAAAVIAEASPEPPPSSSSEKPSDAPSSPPAKDGAVKRGLFGRLPIFRRNTPGEFPVEKPTEMPRSGSGLAGKEAPLKDDTAHPAALTLERLWKIDAQDQLADPAGLQALFMTEEKLTLEKVIGMAGELPGLRACVLAHGDQVVCASNTVAGVDLRTLSKQAMTMLGQIRESSAQMGLGAVPAVTLHAEQGVLSFLHKGELCLLVLHTDRGFVPGVRERLQEMLGHLADARPALPGMTPGGDGLKS